MGDTPQLTNKWAQLLDDVISGIVGGVAPHVIAGMIETAAPWLRLPIIKQIFEAVVSHFMGKISIDMQGGVNQVVINIQTGSELHKLFVVAAKRKEIDQTGDEDARKKALAEQEAAWDNLGHWDGIAKPH